MATSEVEITTTEWTRITAAGESGTCWKKTGRPILVDHTNLEGADTLPLANVNVAVGKSKRVPLDEDSTEVLGLPADDALDVFYAVALYQAGKLAVDAV